MAVEMKSLICLVSVLVPVLGTVFPGAGFAQEQAHKSSGAAQAAASEKSQGANQDSGQAQKSELSTGKTENAPVVCDGFEASWPEGWQVKPIPYPDQGKGSYSGGMRYRAIKMEDSEPVVIEISVFPRPPVLDKALCPDADVEQLNKIIESIKQGYLASGLSATASEPKKTKLAAMDAFETVLTVTAPGFQMFQNLLICQTDKNVFSLTYSARDKYFDKSRPTYEAFSRSLVLK